MDVVERADIPVMYRSVADEPAAIVRGWAEFEAAVGLRGRRFYAAVVPGEYRVCAELRDGDDPRTLGAQVWTLPGGRYARVRLRGEPPGVYDLIAPTFARLDERPDRERTRPSIEFYRRHDEIDLLLPVA